MDNKAIQKYLRRARRVYYGDKELKKQFIQDLQDALLCYADTNPQCSYSDLIAKFGTPGEIRESFILASDMVKKRNIRYNCFIILCSALVLIIIIIFTAFYVKRAHDFSKGHYVEYIEDNNTPTISPTQETPNSIPYKEYTFN